MAENFEDVVKKLGSSVKKPSADKASAVLAVQIVDNKGKVIDEEEKGAAATELQREKIKREQKTNTLLEAILKAAGGGAVGGGGEGGKTGEGFSVLKGLGLLKLAKWAGALPGAAAATSAVALGGLALSAAGILGAAAIATLAFVAIGEMVEDGMTGWLDAEKGKWGTTDKVSAFIASFFAGDKEGSLINAIDKAWQGAGVGALAGLAVGGLPGAILGGIAGMVLGALLGWIGSLKVADWIDNFIIKLREIWGSPEALSDGQKLNIEKKRNELIADNKEIVKEITELQNLLEVGGMTHQEELRVRRRLNSLEKTRKDNLSTIERETRRLYGSKLGEMEEEFKIAKKASETATFERNVAENIVIARKLILDSAAAKFGVDSDQWKLARLELDAAKDDLAEKEAHNIIMEGKYKEAETARDNEQIKYDKRYESFLGNVRLFFAGELESQEKQLEAAWNVKRRGLNDWAKVMDRVQTLQNLFFDVRTGPSGRPQGDAGRALWKRILKSTFGFDVEVELKKFMEHPVDYIWDAWIGMHVAIGHLPSKLIRGMTMEVGPKGYSVKRFHSKRPLWDQIIEKLFPKGLIDFINDPVKYILTEWLGWEEGKVQIEQSIFDKMQLNIGRARPGRESPERTKQIVNERRRDAERDAEERRVAAAKQHAENMAVGAALLNLRKVSQSLPRSIWATTTAQAMNAASSQINEEFSTASANRRDLAANTAQMLELKLERAKAEQIAGRVEDIPKVPAGSFVGHLGNTTTNIGVGGGDRARRPIYVGHHAGAGAAYWNM